jgi:hypothetical protein
VEVLALKSNGDLSVVTDGSKNATLGLKSKVSVALICPFILGISVVNLSLS